MVQNGAFDQKLPTSGVVWIMAQRDLCVGPESIHRCTEFHKCGWGLVVLWFPGAGVLELVQAHQQFVTSDNLCRN